MMKTIRIATVAALVALIAAPASAQKILKPNPIPPKKPAATAPKAPAKPGPKVVTAPPTQEPAIAGANIAPNDAPPYEDQLLRLSEILGGLHYLRDLCKSGEGDAWREQMQSLIDTEEPDDLRRARMVDRFNRGYEGFHSVYLACTVAAATATDRYLDEGARIAAEITARYGK
jgi:uncharacterized protein (TIGR02301 family)